MPSELQIDHLTFYVADAVTASAELTATFGLRPVAESGSVTGEHDCHTIVLAHDAISVRVEQGVSENHPASDFVALHGDGVGDIALRVSDVAAVFDRAVAAGARPVAEPNSGPGGPTARISVFGDVAHTLVPAAGLPLPDRFRPLAGAPLSLPPVALLSMDHFAVCLEQFTLDETVRIFREGLDMQLIFTENIDVGTQVMRSQVVQDAACAFTLTMLEPAGDDGQIDAYLKQHGGSGVQHVACSVGNIVSAVTELQQRGMRFLTTPGSYFDALPNRIQPRAHSIHEIRALNILVDEDHDGQLIQIFARSEHPRNTFFFEIIERVGARTFGSSNIRALYAAVEIERHRDPDYLS